jgi:hypothetical protein
MKIRPGRRPGAAKPGARVTTLLTSPGRDRAAANPPPKPGGPRAPSGGGACYASISTHKSPHPLARRELGPLARAGLSRPPASSVGRIGGDSVDEVAEHHGAAAGP